MNKRLLYVVCCFLVASVASSLEKGQDQRTSPLLTVDRQLRQTETECEITKRMFTPWYAGPLLTPGAHNVPAGQYLMQPYLFVVDTFATFDNHRHSKNIADIWTINPVLLFQMGWLTWLDCTITAQGIYRKQSSKHTFYWGDTSIEWGFQLMQEKPYYPAVRFTITESIPTGRYEKLHPEKNGIDATGSGSYTTNFALNFSKVLWFVSTHPLSFRTSFNYAIPAPVRVREFNAYGGGKGTRGKIRPGNTLAIDTSVELSLTQKWVLAIDLVYTYQNRSPFSGHKGHTLRGQTASVGTPSNDSLSVAPAIEYNHSDHVGFLAGVWFTVTGRNATDFVGGALTMYYAW